MLVSVVWMLGVGKHAYRARRLSEKCEGGLGEGTEVYEAWPTTVSKRHWIWLENKQLFEKYYLS